MKQGSWGWVQRVLRGASRESRSSHSQECTCLGRRDLASAASVSGGEACNQRSLLLHANAATTSGNILGPWQYGTGAAQVRKCERRANGQLFATIRILKKSFCALKGRLRTWVMVFAAGTAAGTLVVTPILAPPSLETLDTCTVVLLQGQWQNHWFSSAMCSLGCHGMSPPALFSGLRRTC
jgi:hypothetical protein